MPAVQSPDKFLKMLGDLQNRVRALELQVNGGLIFQAGVDYGGAAATPVTFPQAFTAPPYIFMQCVDGSYCALTLAGTTTTTQFTWQNYIEGHGTGYANVTINWLAIGH